ncbi:MULTISPECIES: GGDEF domain-containing protein [unclassified Rhodococcus (in: high G+C Gram-positive bacteria)]|uniref:GGDEF domain-containing protein n=1 Tax=unclassified Rhodococcus (in: high G+C Gram-positive bacteria) TaxID=192944 RepID=UPI001446BF7E|nr:MULTISPECIES: GGDEF domain-containing protein [unclassified Rhodococcus (in: high G+C Gram-positive bacteria)]
MRRTPATPIARARAESVRIWKTAHRYDMFTDYLVDRGLIRSTRVAVVVTLLVLGMQPLLFRLGESASSEPRLLAMSVVVIVVDIGWAVLLWRAQPWLDVRLSLCFVTTSCIFLGGSALTMSGPLLGLMACSSYAAILGYVVFFHGFRVFALTMASAAAMVTIISVREIIDGTPLIQVITIAATILAVISTVPIMTLMLMGILTLDAEASEFDSLTGTLNRRGLHREIRRPGSEDGTIFVVYLLDLDGFKSVNDAHGHQAGDAVLVAVSKALGEAVPDAALARVGGEEFVLMERRVAGESVNLSHRAELLRTVVRTSSQPAVTASVGISLSAPVPGTLAADPTLLLNRLIASADEAMYTAKNAGGDRTHVGDVVDVTDLGERFS